MAEIEIYLGAVRIEIDVIGNDENTASILTKINVIINHANGQFNYSANDIGFLCFQWDHFTRLLNNDNSEIPIILQSTSNEFNLELHKMDDKFRMVLKCQEFIQSQDGITVPDLNYRSKISREEFQLLRDVFNNVPKWW